MLEKWEKDWINAYNKESYERLSKDLDGYDLEYLEKITKEI